MHDLRHAIRSLGRQPGLTLTLLLTIAIADLDRVVSLLTRDTRGTLAPLSYDA